MRYVLLLALPAGLLVAARPHTAPVAAPAGTGHFLRAARLSPLWQSSDDAPDDRVHNGFFGSNYRRLELVFTQMRRDAKTPGRYYVQGKDRRSQRVRAFSGTLTFETLEAGEASSKVLPQPYSSHRAVCACTSSPAATTPTAAPSAAPWPSILGATRTAAWLSTPAPPTRPPTTAVSCSKACGPTPSTGRKSTVLVKNGTAVTYQILSDFDIGDRGMQINPKYTRVGWDSYWDNAEWWADSPVARQ